MEEKSLFIEFMGDPPMIRVLDYLLTERELDFSITDMTENSGVSLNNTSGVLIGFREKGIARCINSEEKRGRIYELTKQGEEIQKKI